MNRAPVSIPTQPHQIQTPCLAFPENEIEAAPAFLADQNAIENFKARMERAGDGSLSATFVPMAHALAAPDLLAAVKAALDQLDAALHCAKPPLHPITEYAPMLRDAITKAEGGAR